MSKQFQVDDTVRGLIDASGEALGALILYENVHPGCISQMKNDNG